MILIAEPQADQWLIHQARWLDCPSEVPVRDHDHPSSYKLVETEPGWYMTYPAVYVGQPDRLRPEGKSWHSKLLHFRATHWMPMPEPPSQRILHRTNKALYANDLG